MGWTCVAANNGIGNISLFDIEVFFVLQKVKLNYFIFYGIKVRQYNTESCFKSFLGKNKVFRKALRTLFWAIFGEYIYAFGNHVKLCLQITTP